MVHPWLLLNLFSTSLMPMYRSLCSGVWLSSLVGQYSTQVSSPRMYRALKQQRSEDKTDKMTDLATLYAFTKHMHHWQIRMSKVIKKEKHFKNLCIYVGFIHFWQTFNTHSDKMGLLITGISYINILKQNSFYALSFNKY